MSCRRESQPRCQPSPIVESSLVPTWSRPVADLGGVELDPEIRKSGDGGTPAVLQGEDSPSAKPLFAFARNVAVRVEEIKAGSSESVIQIQ